MDREWSGTIHGLVCEGEGSDDVLVLVPWPKSLLLRESRRPWRGASACAVGSAKLGTEVGGGRAVHRQCNSRTRATSRPAEDSAEDDVTAGVRVFLPSQPWLVDTAHTPGP